MKEKQFVLFNITINRNIHPEYPEADVIVQPDLSTSSELSVRTDFSNSKSLLRKRKNTMVTLNVPSQVHEFIIHYLLTHYPNIKGINFLVKDQVRVIVIIQIQLYWWQKVFEKDLWTRRCWNMTKMVSEMMPVGYCTIKFI